MSIQSGSSLMDGDDAKTWQSALAALEHKYSISYFQLHNNLINGWAVERNTPLMKGESENAGKKASLKEQQAPMPRPVTSGGGVGLHTLKELQQPLRQVPVARSGHLLLPCEARRSLILHGGLGIGPLDLLNDTWEYLIDEQRWVELICRGTAVATGVLEGSMPPKAFGQCGALFGGGRYLFVHGGITSGENNVLLAYQLDIERRLWKKLCLDHPLPTMWGSVAQTLLIPTHEGDAKGVGAGEGASAPQQQQSRQTTEVVVVFGGMQESTAFNSTYFLYLSAPPLSMGRRQYTEDEKRVVVKLPDVAPLTFPGRRRACSAVCKDFFFFIFGGRDKACFYNDLWVLNAYTRQWIMVREETPLQWMRAFFLHPFDAEPGRRIMDFVKALLDVRRDDKRCRHPTAVPQSCVEHNSTARWRTGAVMVSRGSDIFVHGGFTFDTQGAIETHKDMHVYNYVRHVWRVVSMSSRRKMPAFPAGYFRASAISSSSSPSPSPLLSVQGGGGAPPPKAGPEQEPVSPPNLALVMDIDAASPVGRTMAAMCADPVLPGFRFFLFGGRSEDEPSGDLYDVRIDVTHPTFDSGMTMLNENGEKHLSNSDEKARAAPGVNVPDAAYSPELLLLPSSLLSSPSSAAAAGALLPLDRQHLGKRRLWEQATDWVRAALLEEQSLRRTMQVVVQPEQVVSPVWLREASERCGMMQKKVDKFHDGLVALVWCSPPFLQSG
ncbi:hypothetical protein DQ04_06591000 [Trypanosoma grayi]|uniref:hypothetical protein n=1 Tax=Trypanosoma grayi TaxID=71804 RepID=UPI0004F4A3C3|nr:hypothetical protein DQ04_06591000 [Trypanosoma grayi]KEG08712.1 hypothetical protein DQ04_06591000 [Trypanosoma grayi]